MHDNLGGNITVFNHIRGLQFDLGLALVGSVLTVLIYNSCESSASVSLGESKKLKETSVDQMGLSSVRSRLQWHNI